MSSPELAALVRYRLEQAEQALRDARILLPAGSYSATVNRAYYAMFYSILALLCVRGMGTSKHSEAIAIVRPRICQRGHV